MDIAYLTGPKEHMSIRSGVLKGYLDAMAEHGLNPGEDRIFMVISGMEAEKQLSMSC